VALGRDDSRIQFSNSHSTVIASEAKQSRDPTTRAVWIASSLALLAMTSASARNPAAHLAPERCFGGGDGAAEEVGFLVVLAKARTHTA